MAFVLVWLLFGLIAAVIGNKKGEGCLAFGIGVLLGPFGVLLALMSGGNRKHCPFCKELIHKEATVCPKCQREQDGGGS